MERYTPFWSQIVDSSLWMEDERVIKVFLTMWGLQDTDHVVRCTPFAIGKRCWGGCKGWTLEAAEKEVVRSLQVLASPDRKRNEPQEHEGRRVKKVSDGWLILNGEKYHRKMVEANRRAYKARKQAEYRAAKQGTPLPGELAYRQQCEQQAKREDRQEP